MSDNKYGQLTRHELKLNKQTLDCLQFAVREHNNKPGPKISVSQFIEETLREDKEVIAAKNKLFGYVYWDQRKPIGRPKKS